ncbi:MAG: hypothetical protein AAF517_15660, partial [Planctomycetota bacterium]
MFRSLWRTLLGLPLGLSLVSCVTIYPTDDLPEKLSAGKLDAVHVVFLCEGMMKDLGSSWDKRLQKDLHERNVVALRVGYFGDPLGVVFNWSSVAPGKRLAQLADDITEAHERSGDPRPLHLDAVSFSHGGEVLLSAASRVKKARFRKWVTINSSSFAFSGESGRWIEEGRVETIRNYWSPIDIMTLLAPLGCGSFGMRFGGPEVENR